MPRHAESHRLSLERRHGRTLAPLGRGHPRRLPGGVRRWPAANLAGGTHHAFRDRGEGFCVFNDAAVAARAMQAEGRAERILIVDCDVHQGNGTASILKGDDSIFTFSIHGARNFPFTKEDSDLDIELPDGCTDQAYLLQLDARPGHRLRPRPAELVIYLAGADPYKPTTVSAAWR
jgi:acetoin utilization deacetylase AcuC-like enzyme